jgi:hypothetical protein
MITVDTDRRELEVRDTTRTGAVGEFLVAADLTRQSCLVIMAGPGFPFDLIVWKEGKFFSVQVKATAKISKRKSCYEFMSKGRVHRNYDLIAYVAIDTGYISYLPFYKAKPHLHRLNHPHHEKGLPSSCAPLENLGTHSLESALTELETHRSKYP